MLGRWLVWNMKFAHPYRRAMVAGECLFAFVQASNVGPYLTGAAKTVHPAFISCWI